jgi:hypothetical protein
MGVAALGAIVLLAVLQLIQAIARRSSGNRP